MVLPSLYRSLVGFSEPFPSCWAPAGQWVSQVLRVCVLGAGWYWIPWRFVPYKPQFFLQAHLTRPCWSHQPDQGEKELSVQFSASFHPVGLAHTTETTQSLYALPGILTSTTSLQGVSSGSRINTEPTGFVTAPGPWCFNTAADQFSSHSLTSAYQT